MTSYRQHSGRWTRPAMSHMQTRTPHQLAQQVHQAQEEPLRWPAQHRATCSFSNNSSWLGVRATCRCTCAGTGATRLAAWGW